MLALVGSLVSSLASGILAPILGYFTSKDTITLQGFQAAASADTDAYKAYLAAQVQVDTLRASQNMWWGARLLYLVGGGAAVTHFAAVMLDSTFRFGWGVPKCPAPYDTYEWAIVQTFFLLTPAAPLLSAVTAWFHRT